MVEGTMRKLTAILAADMAGYSRLMEVDEAGILDRQKRHRREVIDPTLQSFGGEIVKSTGDGLIVAFTSVQDAVRAALAIQTAMQAREGGTDEAQRILYRVGINLGDVVFEDGDVFGDAVNVAARLETLARPGGVCVADLVHQLIADRLDVTFHDLGVQRVKNISRHIRVWQWSPEATVATKAVGELALTQEVRFCTAADGVQIAYARIGKGPPILKAPNWLNHLEYEWRSPTWAPRWRAFARHNELIRFDQRGLSQGCAFSIRYAVEHPQRVTCLVLLGGYLRGRLMRGSAEEERLYNMATTMIRQGWGSPNRAFRHFFTESFMPDATPEQAAHFDELQRITVTPENALRIWQMNAEVDVTALAARVTAPALVLHCRDDRMCPLREGRRMAASIPNARFVELEGANHAPLDGTPAFDQFFREVEAFLKAHASD